jgi:hypothetical protein
MAMVMVLVIVVTVGARVMVVGARQSNQGLGPFAPIRGRAMQRFRQRATLLCSAGDNETVCSVILAKEIIVRGAPG